VIVLLDITTKLFSLVDLTTLFFLRIAELIVLLPAFIDGIFAVFFVDLPVLNQREPCFKTARA
jgi:hypothetical protein